MHGLIQVENVSAAAIHAGPRWYAIHTRARHEKRIDLSLRRGGMDTFLPVVREVHRWSDRRKEVTLPLFPCYVFVRILPDSSARLRVLKTPGVLNFVGRPDELSNIPDQEIEQVRAVVQQRDRFFPAPSSRRDSGFAYEAACSTGWKASSVRIRVPPPWWFPWN
jgi:transcription antitermination factor NusG